MSYFDLSKLSVRRKVILFIVALMVALSWAGSLDKYSEAYIDDALISGGMVYATARGINAAVSVLQGTEITPAVATFSVGQVLDPVNDLIERFSTVLLVALGSLALQKILLEIFSHQGFSILVTILGLMLILTSFTAKYTRAFNLILKLFALTIAVRFALSLVVLASAGVDYAFLQDEDAARHSEMIKLQGELHSLSSASHGAPTAEEINKIQTELAALRKIQSDQQRSVADLRVKVDGLNVALNENRSEVPITCRFNPWCDEGANVNAKKIQILITEAELDAAETVQESTEASIGKKREYLKCARQEQEGLSCSFWGRAYSWVSPTSWKDRFSKVADNMNDYASNIISLLMSFLAKTVLIPLLFLYTLLQVYKLILRRLIDPVGA